MHWNGRNENGEQVPCGIYYLRVQTQKQVKVHQMLLLKQGPPAADHGICGSVLVCSRQKAFCIFYSIENREAIMAFRFFYGWK